MKYTCSDCGSEALYDGRCGDGPVLVCDCRKKGHYAYGVFVTTAKPIPADEEAARKDAAIKRG